MGTLTTAYTFLVCLSVEYLRCYQTHLWMFLLFSIGFSSLTKLQVGDDSSQIQSIIPSRQSSITCSFFIHDIGGDELTSKLTKYERNKDKIHKENYMSEWKWRFSYNTYTNINGSLVVIPCKERKGAWWMC